MALPTLTARTFGATQLQLTYADGRQYFLNYRDIISTELDATDGITKVRIYLSGGLDESMFVTNTDLVALGTTASAFLTTLNTYL
jgi:hypothetical protein